MKKSVKTYLLRTWNYSFFLYNCSAYLHLQASSHRYSVNSTIKNHGGISNNTVRRISTKSFWEIIVPQEWQVWYMRWHICEQTDGRSLDIYEPPGSVSASQDVHNHFDSLDLSDEKPHRLSRGVGKAGVTPLGRCFRGSGCEKEEEAEVSKERSVSEEASFLMLAHCRHTVITFALIHQIWRWTCGSVVDVNKAGRGQVWGLRFSGLTARRVSAVTWIVCDTIVSKPIFIEVFGSWSNAWKTFPSATFFVSC